MGPILYSQTRGEGTTILLDRATRLQGVGSNLVGLEGRFPRLERSEHSLGLPVGGRGNFPNQYIHIKN